MDNHWEKMPKSWTTVLNDLPPENLTNLLDTNAAIQQNVWPLSLLCLQKIIPILSIPREPNNDKGNCSASLNRSDSNNNPNVIDFKSHPKTKNILTKKNIKAKKRHEIEQMSELTANIANEHGIKYIVDFGAGLGHLARLLTYGYRLNVCCLEMQIALTEQAR